MRQNIRFYLWIAIFVTAIFFVSVGSTSATLRVNVMPSGVASPVNVWDSYPYTWPGNNLELWGNVYYDGTGTLTYTWNFGAGEGSVSGTVSNRNNIFANHTYTSTGSYIATLTVSDGLGETDTDTVYIDVVPIDIKYRTNLAIQRALKYLYMNKTTTTVNGYTAYYWSGTYGRSYGNTGLAVLAFEDHGHREKNNHEKDIYAETVEYGLNYLFYSLGTTGASDSPPSDSDLNGNNRKVYCANYNNMYENGILTMALAGTESPEETVRDCAKVNIRGNSYREVLEDMVDALAYAQNDGGTKEGGWRYGPNYSSSDNSVSQWPALGLAAAKGAPWNIDDSNPAYPDFPAWVKTRLQSWINNSQYSNGGFGYTYSSQWVNIAKTGAGIIEMIYAGGGGNLTNAVNFISANWNTTTNDYGNKGDHYAMYAVKKGMQYAGLSTVGGHDWQEEYNQWYVSNQINAGTNGAYWPNSVRIGGAQSTATFALLVMAPGISELPPVADAGKDQEVAEEVDVTLDGTDSYHPDTDRSIVLYEWDFDYDGINFDVDATGAVVTKVDGYTITNGTDTQDFTVALKVTDDNIPPRTSKTDTAIITVSNGNIGPVSVPGGPYLGGVGEDITLDASGSYDENSQFGANPIFNAAKGKWDEIEIYQWDLDGDGLYGTEDSPAEPEGMIIILNFGPAFIGTKTVGLKVTDSFGRSAVQSTQVTTIAVSDLYPIGYEETARYYNRRTRKWCVAWKVYIKNDGNGGATEVTAELTGTSIPSDVTVIDNNVSWSGSIDPGETQLSDDEFRYTYTREDVDLTRITWDIEFTDVLGVRHVVRSVPQYP